MNPYKIVWKVPLLLLVVAIASIALGCGSDDSSETTASVSAAADSSSGSSVKADEDYKITLITGEQKDPFYVTMAAGAQQEGERVGATVDWQPPTSFDPTVQIPVMDSVRASKPQFLIAVPTDSKALVAPLQKFGDEGIPVITADTDVVDPTARLGNITSDNERGGELAAKTLAEEIGEQGKVFLLCTPPGITTGQLRKQGFEKEIANYPDIDYVGVDIYDGTDPTDAARVMAATLKREADLAGVVACDGPSGLGASTAIGEAGEAGEVKLISFDAGPDLVNALKRGVVSDLLIQQSYNIGAKGVDFAVKYLNGGFKIPAETQLPYVLGTEENIDSPEIQKFLAR